MSNSKDFQAFRAGGKSQFLAVTDSDIYRRTQLDQLAGHSMARPKWPGQVI
jgi:hypothetical protein